jgi:hypothetical protein
MSKQIFTILTIYGSGNKELIYKDQAIYVWNIENYEATAPLLTEDGLLQRETKKNAHRGRRRWRRL